MRFTIIVSIILILAVLGTWYVFQGDVGSSPTTSGSDQGIKLN